MNIRDYVEVYDLVPKAEQGQDTFYGKARVYIDKDGSETLCSYDTPIARKMPNGEVQKLWDDWTTTTGKHIYAFCGMRKKEWDVTPLYEEEREIER